MDRMTIPMEWKATGDDGILEGYAGTFGNVDLGDDVLERGAFALTLREDIQGEGIPMLADHMVTTSSVLGTLFDGKEDARGLSIRARFSAAPSAQDVYIKAREGHLRSLSIGYSPVKYRFEERDGVQVRVLEQVKLYEVSVVVFPMNPQATIDRVKALAHDLGAAGRKQLADGLRPELVDATRPDAEPAVAPAGEDTEPVAGGDVPADEGDGSAEVRLVGEPGPDMIQEVSPTSGGDAEAAHVEVKERPDGKSGWDRWRSEALLHGTDPDAKADTAQLARMRESIRLNDEAFARDQEDREQKYRQRATAVRDRMDETDAGIVEERKRWQRMADGERLVAEGRAIITNRDEQDQVK